ncbi:lanthionine synthetase LanC family protein [Rhizobium rhizogenes]|uniref:lanthionine synthetase LanC family protein n=1 Tax=Rhizobium rhizogenes TaxID=359 RepID=UPI001297DE16|nr:lanthionine synthetase LanC family protein [Rhizobium rhizogenes]MQB35188.1 hypothetical protein [Rhizobium rhizogenes]
MRFVLPPDLVIQAVGALPPAVRHGLSGDDDDVALTRPRSRRKTMVVNRETAQLLKAFSEPMTIPEAVLLYSNQYDLNPESVLTESFPVLRHLHNARYLVPADAVSSGTPSNGPITAPGIRIGRWTVTACLQSLEDSDVYRVEDGTAVAALKLVNIEAGSGVRRRLRHEVRMLELLAQAGVPDVPLLLDAAVDESTPWLATGWIDGDTAFSAAARLRGRKGLGSPTLVAMCAMIGDSFAALHERGFLHGDVHPRNVIVTPTRATLIDFGLSRTNDAASPGRGGVGWAFEPEYAAAVLAGRTEPAVTAAGEQYALAALFFLLLTGRHHHPFRLERSEMFEQIAEADPLMVSSAGAVVPDGVQAALAQALSRTPGDRHPNVRAFVAALRQGMRSTPTGRPNRSGTLASALVTRLRQPPDMPSFAQWPKPAASINFGAAGIAFALYRLARLRDDASLLAAADHWSALARHSLPEPAAFVHASVGIDPMLAGQVSLFHATPGVHMVDGLVAEATGDFDSVRRAVPAFLAAVEAAEPRQEIVFGRAGGIPGAALLLRRLTAAALRPERDLLARWTAARLGAVEVAVRAEMQEQPLGFAHGLAGITHALVVGHRECGTAPPDDILDFFLNRAEAAPYGNPVREGLARSWCNGSGGMALTLASVHGLRGDPRSARLLETAAVHAAAEPTGGNGSLCCGSGGRAYALLAVARVTGDARWCLAATQCADAARSTMRLDGPLPHSLFKGALGIALLLDEVAQPLRAAFPCLEPEPS